jgi:hypothetical protein
MKTHETTSQKHRELFAVPHQYSCGGYFLAERFDRYTWKGQEYEDGRGYWLLSGRMGVLSRHQVLMMTEACESRGEIVSLQWVDELPDNGFLLNIR